MNSKKIIKIIGRNIRKHRLRNDLRQESLSKNWVRVRGKYLGQSYRKNKFEAYSISESREMSKGEEKQ